MESNKISSSEKWIIWNLHEKEKSPENNDSGILSPEN